MKMPEIQIWDEMRFLKEAPDIENIRKVFNEIGIQWRYNRVLRCRDVKCNHLGYYVWTIASEDVDLDICERITASYKYAQVDPSRKKQLQDWDGAMVDGEENAVNWKPFDLLHTHHQKYLSLSKSIAYRKSYHPLLEYTDKLKWDGVPRIETTFSDQGLNFNAGPYQSWVESFLFVEAYIRAKYPASPRRSHPLLKGPKHIGKSAYGAAALPKMGGMPKPREDGSETDDFDPYFNDNFSFDTTKKERQEGIRGFLVVEASDIDKSIGRERGALKAFLSTKTGGGVRHAYDRDVDRTLRSAIIYFTANETVLPDNDEALSTRMIQFNVTGKCERKNGMAFPRMGESIDKSDPSKGTLRDQMWAEAKHRVEETAAIVNGKRVATNPFLTDELIDGAPRWNAQQGAFYYTQEGALTNDHISAIEEEFTSIVNGQPRFRKFVTLEEMHTAMYKCSDLYKEPPPSPYGGAVIDKWKEQYLGDQRRANILKSAVEQFGLYRHENRRIDGERKRGYHLTRDQEKINETAAIIDFEAPRAEGDDIIENGIFAGVRRGEIH